MSFASPYQQIIHLSRYARKNKRGRRENWGETLSRYLGFFTGYLERNHNHKVSSIELGAIQRQMYELGSLPSMRALMAAGPMLAQEHLTGYNCSYVAVDSPRAFDEILYLLMCTCGVGFSVERQLIAQLPLIPAKFKTGEWHISVPDTRVGWAQSYQKLISCLYRGTVPTWDTSQVRGKGAPLKTTGGTASGPEPLEQLFRFTVEMFTRARGRRLTSLECHDIVCHIGEIIMVGDVRQAALISLSNPSDLRMRDAKAGNWYSGTPWRQLANNSAAYAETPTPGVFMQEWLALYESKSGERGIFNRAAAMRKNAVIGRANTWPNGDDIEFGTNPCGEINLRPAQLCNLSEGVAREDDTWETLQEKVRIATILGTWQSALTRFKHVRAKWRSNCEEERLLGVSLTGIMDCPLINTVSKEAAEGLSWLRESARKVNAAEAEKLGIPASKAITCVKPSGTVSQLVDASSGIHARYARHYIRRINMSRQNPLTKFMVAEGLPHAPHRSKPNDILVFEFPMRAPNRAVFEEDRTAIETLEHWKMVRDNWTDHNPSTTVTVKEQEWPAVGGWVYSNFDNIGGLAFYPASDAVYQQAPYEAVSEEQYRQLDAAMPAHIHWEDLHAYDAGRPVQEQRPEFACVAGACELR